MFGRSDASDGTSWKAEATFTKLADTLKTFGVTGTDYTGISPQALTEGLKVAAIVHRATIDVDEQGTVAAAATAITAQAISADPRFESCPDRVDLNHPFAYVIEDITNGEILFAGRVDKPIVG